MQWKNIEDFLPFIMNEVTPCPQDIALQYLRNALAEFCSESWAWTMKTDKELVKAGDDEIDVYPSNAMPDGVMEAYKEDMPYSLDKLSLEGNIITLKEPVDSDSHFQFLIALKTPRECKVVPGWMYEDYLETICFGAKYKLASMAGQSWANPELVSYAYNQFRKGISTAGAKKRAKGNTQRTRKVKPKPFSI